MKFRQLGHTGLEVSEIGWGSEHMEGASLAVTQAVVNTALDGGVNIIDAFMPQPGIRSNLGHALAGRRNEVILQGHIGAVMKNGQYARSRDVQQCDVFIKDFLSRFNTDYIDIGMMHFIDTDEDYTEAFESDYIEYVQSLKRDGVIRFLGVSTHNPSTGMKMIGTGLIDVVMFSINPVFDFASGENMFALMFQGKKMERLKLDTPRTEFYAACARKGVGITVMKALGGGRLLSAELSSLGVPLSVSQCVSFALDRPSVSSVLLGAKDVSEMEQALSYEHSTSEERDYTSIMESGLPLQDAKCLYCNHCLPCPQGIDIAAVTKFLDIAVIHDSASINAHYEALSAHGGDCSQCGSCEENCPFGINIVTNMREAARIFGK